MAKEQSQYSSILGPIPELNLYNDLKTFEAMSQDQTIRSVLDSINFPIFEATYEIQEPSNPTSAEKRITSIITNIFFQLLDFKSLIKTATNSNTYGFQVFDIIRANEEVVYTFKSDEGNTYKKRGMFVIPKEIRPLPSTTIKRDFNSVSSEGKLLYLTQHIDGEIFRLPRERLLIVTTGAQSPEDWRGISPLYAVYKDWWYKERFWRIEGRTLEKWGPGIDIFNLGDERGGAEQVGQGFGEEAKDPGGSEKQLQEIINGVQKVANDVSSGRVRNIVNPPGQRYQSIERKDQYPDILTAITKLENSIYKRFGATHLILGGQGSPSSGAFATTVSELFLYLVEGKANVIVDSIQRDLIKKFVDINFGPQERYPQLTVSNINKTKNKNLFLAQQYNDWVQQIPEVRQGILADLGYKVEIATIEKLMKEEKRMAAQKERSNSDNFRGPDQQNNREEQTETNNEDQ